MSYRFMAWSALVLGSLLLNAQETGARLRFSGFGTLGLICNSTDQAEYRRDLSQPRGATRSLYPWLDTRLGVQVNATLTDEVSLVGQAVSKYRYDHTYTPDLTWAFLSYTPSSGLQARIGRLGWDVFQFADTLNVGFSYLWVRPPVEFYGPLLVSTLDGGDIAWTYPLGHGRDIRLKVSYGRASQKVPLASGTVLDLSGAKVFGSYLEFQGRSLSLRLAYAQARTTHDFPPPVSDLQSGLNAFSVLLGDPRLAQQASDYSFTDRRLQYVSATSAWQEGPLRIEAAGAQVRTDAPMIADFRSGYLSVGYRLGKFVPYTLVSRIVSEHPAPYLGALASSGPQAAALAAGVESLAVGGRSDQTTYSLGLRWDFHPKAALKAQLDRVLLADPGWNFLWQDAQPGWDGRATEGSVVLDFVF